MQGVQKNQRPTCSHYGKLGHTSNKCWSNGKAKFNRKWYNCNQHGHRANECKEKPKFKGKCHKCKKHGHRASECKEKSNFEGKCYNFNKQGHKSYDCKTKKLNPAK